MKYIPEIGVTCGMYNYKHGRLDIHVVATGNDGLLAEIVGFRNTISEVHLEYKDTTFYPPKPRPELSRELIEDVWYRHVGSRMPKGTISFVKEIKKILLREE